MTRRAFDERLEHITETLRTMAETVTQMVDLAVQVAFTGDENLVETVIDLDKEVDRLEQRAINEIVTTISLEAPVAGDLRLLCATLLIVGEIEMAGDDAEKFAKRARKIAGTMPDELRAPLEALGESVKLALQAAMSIYEDYSPSEADRIEQHDDYVDKAYKDARAILFERIQLEPDQVRRYYLMVELFHALEHVADHAVEIAKRLRTLEPE